jgi:CoA:oxalate CoA-transferase
MMSREILEGIRVLDHTMWQLGPVAGMMLAEMGAEVIHIEPPQGDTGRQAPWPMPKSRLSGYFETNNRSKKSMVLDLTKRRAKEILYQLVGKSDIYMENLRPGVPRKLGVDYETLREYNPNLIYLSASSFGPKGPDRDKPGFDYSGMARSGGMWWGRKEGEPIYWYTGASDQIGAIVLCLGGVAALLARERFGAGQKVETSHLTATMWLLGLQIQATYLGTRLRPALRDDVTNPLWNHYKCADGAWIALLCGQPQKSWPSLCEVLGLQDYANDPRFADTRGRSRNRKECIALLDKAFSGKPRERWIGLFEGKPILWERVQDYKDLGNDPQVIANEYMTDYEHPIEGLVKWLHFPLNFAETPAIKKGAAPKLGEHTGEVLVDILGYTSEQVPELLNEIGRAAEFKGATPLF